MFLSLVRPDRISSPITRMAAVITSDFAPGLSFIGPLRDLLWSNAVARTPLPLKPTPRQTAIFAGFSAAVAGPSFASL
jgi:hypothetical protein